MCRMGSMPPQSAKVLAGKGSANAVVAFGNGLWRKLSSSAPEALGDFIAIDGANR